MNIEPLQISNQIQALQVLLLQEIGDIKSSVAKLDGSLTTEVNALKGTHSSFRNELLGEGGRVSNIEDEQQRAETRQWVHTAVLLPIGAVLHTIASKMGLLH